MIEQRLKSGTHLDPSSSTTQNIKRSMKEQTSGYVPSRREFNAQLNHIDTISNRIHGLLGLVKNSAYEKGYLQPNTISTY